MFGAASQISPISPPGTGTRVADTVASQRAVTHTLVLGYSQGGHIAWARVASTS